jgi:hypothetical protein
VAGFFRWFVFKQKNPNLGSFWKALEWIMFLYFMAIWNILWPFGIIYGSKVQFVASYSRYLNNCGFSGTE